MLRLHGILLSGSNLSGVIKMYLPISTMFKISFTNKKNYFILNYYYLFLLLVKHFLVHVICSFFLNLKHNLVTLCTGTKLN